MSFTLHGLGVSGGIAIGRALLMSHATLDVARLTLTLRQAEREIKRLDRALEIVREELLNMRAQNKASAVAPGELIAFIDLHLLFLADPELVDATKQIIRERLCNAEWALVQRMEQLVEQFEQAGDPYLRERKYDVMQIVERVVQELLGKSAKTKSRLSDEEHRIIVAHDLSPTDAIVLKKRHFASFVTDVGGATSHTAILARSMAIPAIVGLVSARAMIRDGEWLIVDGQRGVLIIDPDEQVLDEYRIRKELLELERSKLKRLKSTLSQTLDGIQINLFANIEMPSDMDAVLESGADGIGLFRTEFLFLGRGDLPSEDEQFEAYREVVTTLKGRPAVIRTFDLGGDKMLDLQRTPTNPALGRRAIRFSLTEPKMFHTQLRAILRASHYGKVKILLPMLSHVRQIDASLNAIAQAKASLREDNIPFGDDIAVGGMIEVPGAALIVQMFLKRLSFLSIGTNDLIQYTLAVDRSDEEVAGLYDSLHPAVLTLIAHVLGSCDKAGVPVSVCGEMAGDPKFTWLLLGMGLKDFSMQPAQIMEVKSRIIQADVGEIAPIARRIIKQDETGKIEEAVEKLNLGRRPAQKNGDSPNALPVKTTSLKG